MLVNYSKAQILLHKICLSSNFIKKNLFEFEKNFYKSKSYNHDNNQHVFITSLPRAGTTALLNFLFSSRQFASLTYKDMPFVLCPNINKFLFKKKNLASKPIKRFHNDGLYIQESSPESFDEVFFSLFESDSINSEELKIYINLILYSYSKNRYLSKNYNNFKRINFLNQTFPNSKFVILFRDPINHTNSLFNQHLNFSKLQKKNNFITEYMNFLGHNEFGTNHLSFITPSEYFNHLNCNYWLEQWCLFYEFMLREFKKNDNCIFISYENLVDKKFINFIFNYFNISSNFEFKVSQNSNSSFNQFSKNLINRSKEIYIQLKVLSDNYEY